MARAPSSIPISKNAYRKQTKKSKAFHARLEENKSKYGSYVIPFHKTTVPEVKAIVKKELSKELETKFRSEITALGTNFTSSIVAGKVVALLPKIVQDQNNGNSPMERVGAKISVRSLYVDAHWNLTVVPRSTAIVVVYMILTAKRVRSIADFPGSNVQNIASNLLKSGTTTEVQGFTGAYSDWVLPVNDREYTVLKKGSFLLGKNTGTIQDTSTAGNQPLYGNHVCKSMRFKLNCPKTLTYDLDSNSPRTKFYPNNYAPFMVCGYYHQDQTVPDVLNQDLTATIRTSIYYDDA